MKKKQKAGLIGLVVGGLALSACGYNVPSDMVAVHIQHGPFQARKVVDCKPASSRGWWSNDDYALFPTSEREWDATGQKGSDSGPFTSVTRDNVIMRIPITVRFTLKTDCTDLKDFYTKFARRFGVEFQDDGTYNGAWITVLRKLVKDPSDTALDRIVQEYNWRDVWNNPQTKAAIEQRLNDTVQTYLKQTAHAEYFDNVTVLLGNAKPQNPELATAVASEQTKVAQAQSDQAQADADRAKALAQVAVAQAEAKKKQAEIDGYGGVEAYERLQAIQQGLNPFQPTYVVPNGAAK